MLRCGNLQFIDQSNVLALDYARKVRCDLTKMGSATIRCDDIFVDSDPTQFEKICEIIRRYDFQHLVGITPLGEGRRLWAMKGRAWTMQLGRYGLARTLLVNRRILKMTGEKCIGSNAQLMKVLNTELSNGAIPSLHGLHHYRYDIVDKEEVYHELSAGVRLLRRLFSVDTRVFTPPFNHWNHETEAVCEKLNLSVNKCSVAFDKSLRSMNNHQIEQIAREQSSSPEVFYHPYQLPSLEKFEIYLKTRRKYCLI